MDERSSDQIQRDIERTRGQMSETIDALERRLSPGEIIDELWGRVKGGETGSNMGETIREHPLPLALMGLGLGWLAIEKATESRTQQLRDRYGERGEGTYARAEGRVGPYRGDDVIDPEDRYGSSDGIGSRIGETAGNVKDRVTEMGGDLKDRLSSATGAARDRMSEMGDRMHSSDGSGDHGGGGPGMGERAHHLRDRASGEFDHARDSMRRRGNQLESTFRSLLDDYPLALGAVTFGLGLAAGASAPTTRREDELMGHASDTLREEVTEVARETTQRAREVAGEAARAAKSEAESEGMGDDLKSKAERVMQAATSTARQEAESQGLSAEGLKERGREIGKHTAESARDGSATRQEGSTGLHAGSGMGSSPPNRTSTGSAGSGSAGSAGFQATPGSQGAGSAGSSGSAGSTGLGTSTGSSRPGSMGSSGSQGLGTSTGSSSSRGSEGLGASTGSSGPGSATSGGMSGPGRTGSSTGSSATPGTGASQRTGMDQPDIGRSPGSSGGLSSPTSNRPTGGTGNERPNDWKDGR